MSKSSTALLSLSLPILAGTIIFVSAGRWNLPMVWAVLGVLTVFSLTLVATADSGLLRERQSPGPGNQDRFTRPVGIVLFLGHWILVGLDVGRFQWSVAPVAVQAAGLAGYIAALGVMFWAMRVNPFYSSVVRVQHDRGHRLVAAGPYRFVRHPGYAASILAFLSGGLAFGSWIAMVPILAFVGLFVRRTLVEDHMLLRELDGYAGYAERVRYRLIPGIF
ncbi:MAG: isoprenylcysteine carboxylmethyltransferase family protein [Verrucomicrobia bacterium]|nr:isoprenylcysteine carboxylmethyltransferase family protein [Verrucomicrobiota bacterium]